MKNVAVFGAGRIGRIHATNLASLPGVKLKFICDPVGDSAATLAGQLGAEVSTIEAVLADPGIDVVAITSPTSTHSDLITRSAAAGKHIFCEKPVDLSVPRAEDCARTVAAANVACMKDCIPEPKVASLLPDYARNAHGNLAEQNRLVGAQHGADTTQPERKSGGTDQASKPGLSAAPATKPKSEGTAAPSGQDNKAAIALLNKNSCTACHAVDRKVLGPSFQEVGKKHAGKVDYLAGKIKSGGAGVWGPIPMPAQSLSEAEAKTIAAWIAAGAAK